MKTVVSNVWNRFRMSQSGSASLEIVLMAPLLIWAVAATVVYFDGFRSKFNVQKSATTIADAISRETLPLDESYIDGMFDLYEVLTPTVSDRGMRVSVIAFFIDEDNDADEGEFDVIWSEERGAIDDPLDNADLPDFEDRLPLMGNDDRYILVELTADYSNAIATTFGAVLQDIPFFEFVAISPRFTGRTCYQGASDPDPVC